MSISYAEAAALRKAAQRSAKPRNVIRRTTDAHRLRAEAVPERQPNPLNFENVSRPGAYYERPRIKRDLPVVSVRTFFSQIPCLTRSRPLSLLGWVLPRSQPSA